MPTNDDTPKIEFKIIDSSNIWVEDMKNTDDNTPTIDNLIKYINNKGYTGGDGKIFKAIQNLIDRARLNELVNLIPDPSDIDWDLVRKLHEDRTKALKAKIKEGE